jgi:hypothetical protein
MKQELPLRYEELMRVRVPAALIDAIDRAAQREKLPSFEDQAFFDFGAAE